MGLELQVPWVAAHRTKAPGALVGAPYALWGQLDSWPGWPGPEGLLRTYMPVAGFSSEAMCPGAAWNSGGFSGYPHLGIDIPSIITTMVTVDRLQQESALGSDRSVAADRHWAYVITGMEATPSLAESPSGTCGKTDLAGSR